MLANLVQLQGLCEQMDDSAFLPLYSDELTSDVANRLLQYCDIVDELTDTLVQDGSASIKNLHSAGGRAHYVRYMFAHQHGCSLALNASLWNKYCLTPLWLGIQSEKWKYAPDAKKRLDKLGMEEPPRLFIEKETLYIPLYLRTGVEKPEIVNDLLVQIKEVFSLLEGSSSQ